MDRYFYLIWVLIFLLIWLFLFLRRKDTRKEMFLVSLLFGVGGVACEKTNIQDWWQPLTITGTPIGIEDFLIGFAIGGIAAVIYEEMYSKRLRKNRSTLSSFDPGFHLLIFPLLYLTLFFLLEVGSFYSAIIAYSLCLGYILFKRKDLIEDSFLSGLWMLFIGIGIYFILFQIYPNFIQQIFLLGLLASFAAGFFTAYIYRAGSVFEALCGVSGIFLFVMTFKDLSQIYGTGQSNESNTRRPQ